MNNENVINIDPSWKGVVRWGGLSLIGAVVVVVLFIVLVFSLRLTIPPSPGGSSQRPYCTNRSFPHDYIWGILTFARCTGALFRPEKC